MELKQAEIKMGLDDVVSICNVLSLGHEGAALIPDPMVSKRVWRAHMYCICIA